MGEVHLCEDQSREWKTQSRYTPDPGEVEGPVFCGVCNTEMDKTPNVNGPRGFAMAMSGSKSLHDVFSCPHREEDWHKQVVALRTEARNTASLLCRENLLNEADSVLLNRKATVDVGPLAGY